MYITTFYSYKGGVGRTMALTNIAFMLAQAGKRVLIVDFDLEAPGLSTYDGLAITSSTPGIVEYITEYIDSGVAPNVTSYITACNVGQETIWMMSAGDYHSANYAGLLNSIDWGTLYNEQQGFLLMEDLKQQWNQYDEQGFDYVLLDSRTGYTDVGGICTRQMPDAVVVLFVPTSQNIDGLRPIVKTIRAEGPPVRSNKISLLFCPSNVPDLDDQESILSSLLDMASQSLEYKTPAAVIQHYASLDLLQQPIYAKSNPKTKLVRQYRDLYTALISGNLADADGALISAEGLIERYTSARDLNDRSELAIIDRLIARIKGLHGTNPKIAWALAALANKMASPEEEVDALSILVNQGHAAPRVLLHRAIALASLNNDDSAVADLLRIFSTTPLNMFDLAPAANLLRRLLPDQWQPIFRRTIERKVPDISGIAFLSYFLMTDRDGANFAARATIGVSRRGEGSEDSAVSVQHALALIGSGQFIEARNFLFDDRPSAYASDSTIDVFNYAMADWGVVLEPDTNLFRRVIDLRPMLKSDGDVNLSQCTALAHMVVEEWSAAATLLKEALEAPKSALTFSCWNYLLLNEEAINQDLTAMLSLAHAKRLDRPPFLTQA